MKKHFSFRSAVALVAFVLTVAPAAAQVSTVVSQGVRSYALDHPKVFWHTAANCIPASGEFPAFNADKPEVLTRVSLLGGPSRELLHENDSRPPNACNPYAFYSDIVADTNHVYWVDPTGLVRLPTSANVGDPPELVNAAVTGGEESLRAELALGATEIFARTYNGTQSRIYEVDKSTGAATLLVTLNGRATKFSHDGKYLYYILNGGLWRLSFGGATQVKLVADGVTGYHAEGRRKIFLINGSIFTEYVFYGKGRQLFRYDSVSNQTSAPLYTSSNSKAVIYSVTSMGGGGIIALGSPSGVFFLEHRPAGSDVQPGFIFYDQLLMRIPRGGGSGDNLYFRHGNAPVTVDADHLSHNATDLFWRDEDRVLRIPADADALPKTNMRITGIEVTQTIQDLQNRVFLVEGKRTFVRMHVKSDDPNESVPGVYANLSATWQGGQSAPIAPINDGGSLITVRPNPDRKNLGDSYLFELPLSWTSKTDLRLWGHLNPQKLPMQESYANNQLAIGPVVFLASPRLEVRFFAFEHEVSGTQYSPDYTDDVLPTFSWIRRVYPLASSGGDVNTPGPGFRPELSYVFDGGLGDRVMRTHPQCAQLYPNPDDDISLCASAYTNSLLAAWRSQNGDDRFYYGLIDDDPMFPRGQAAGGGTPVASGPAGDPGTSWDSDSTYADWYTGHEIGHTLCRPHPSPASDDPATDDGDPNTTSDIEGCGHSRSDPCYPYAGALIGPAGDVLMGFDSGWMTLPKAVLPSSQWSDMMSYCNFQWISDYTYGLIYDRMMSPAGSCPQTCASAGAGGGADKGLIPPLPGGRGPWLSVFGAVSTDLDRAVIHYIRKLDRVALVPPAGRGPLVLELLDGSGKTLESTFFAPEGSDHEGVGVDGYGVVLPWVDGTRLVRVVNAKIGTVLAEHAVSASAPEIGVPVLDGAEGGPVSGIRRLSWEARDAEGDELSVDILCSHDGGETFLPLFWNLPAENAEINTDKLGGGEAILRVIVSDGVLCSEQDTEPFAITAKPPTPRITSPTDGATVQYGQMVTFFGEADDLQDGSVAPRGLRWSVPGGVRRLLLGHTLSVDDLPVGENTITLTATNSLGLSASTSITVVVHDDLRVPGTSLTVAPQQVGWHVNGTARRGLLQPLEIQVSNSGSGRLRWTATEDADWLELDALEGTAPGTIILFADTSEVEPKKTHVAELVVSNAAVPDQQVIVRVTLSVGDNRYLGNGRTTEPPPPETLFVRGDCNGDGNTSGVADALFMLNRNFVGESRTPCAAACDADGNGSTRGVADALTILGRNFVGGVEIPAPFPECGPVVRPSDQTLGCEEPTARCR